MLAGAGAGAATRLVQCLPDKREALGSTIRTVGSGAKKFEATR